MKPETLETNTARETHELGQRLAARLKRGDCVEVVGPLGAGKTLLVRGLAEGLGCDARLVSSPTYVLVQEYPAENDISLYHIDLYRTSDPEVEFSGLGVEEMLLDGVVVIEWADRLPIGTLPGRHWRVTIEPAGETSRRITVECLC